MSWPSELPSHRRDIRSGLRGIAYAVRTAMQLTRLAALVPALVLASCTNDDGVTCGAGTHEESGTCVADELTADGTYELALMNWQVTGFCYDSDQPTRLRAKLVIADESVAITDFAYTCDKNEGFINSAGAFVASCTSLSVSDPKVVLVKLDVTGTAAAGEVAGRLTLFMNYEAQEDCHATADFISL